MVGVTALQIRPRSSAARYTAAASMPSTVSAPSIRPEPRTESIWGSARRASVSFAPCRTASDGASRRRISSITALTAAAASAVPLYVEPWSPGSNTAETAARAQQAPTGSNAQTWRWLVIDDCPGDSWNELADEGLMSAEQLGHRIEDLEAARDELRQIQGQQDQASETAQANPAEARFSDVDSPQYKAMLAMIETKIDQLDLYQHR